MKKLKALKRTALQGQPYLLTETHVQLFSSCVFKCLFLLADLLHLPNTISSLPGVSTFLDLFALVLILREEMFAGTN